MTRLAKIVKNSQNSNNSRKLPKFRPKWPKKLNTAKIEAKMTRSAKVVKIAKNCRIPAKMTKINLDDQDEIL